MPICSNTKSENKNMETRVEVKVGIACHVSFLIALWHLLTCTPQLLSWWNSGDYWAGLLTHSPVKFRGTYLVWDMEVRFGCILSFLLGWTLTFVLCLMQTSWFVLLSLKLCSIHGARGACSVTLTAVKPHVFFGEEWKTDNSNNSTLQREAWWECVSIFRSLPL